MSTTIDRIVALDTPAALIKWYHSLPQALVALKDDYAQLTEWGRTDEATICWHRMLNCQRLIREAPIKRLRRTVRGLQVMK